MKRMIILLVTIVLFLTPVCAIEYTAPDAPAAAEKYMPDETETFWDGVFEILKKALAEIIPEITETLRACGIIMASVLLVSVLDGLSGTASYTIRLVGSLAVAYALIQPSNALIKMGVSAVQEMSTYTKLLIPVMATATAAQGATSSSAALYTGTAVFNAILSTAITKLVVPLIYVFIVLCIAKCAIGDDRLKALCDIIKGFSTWLLKIFIYIFTGYLGFTGIICGTVDATALKATKLTISGVVPVIGGVISDASETILLSVALMKNAAGVYGLLVLMALCIGPFLNIGVQYLLLKITSSVCGIWGDKKVIDLLKDFTAIMGFILAILGSVCMIFMVSIVCFMKGITYG